MAQKTQKKMSTTTKAGIGAGILAATAAAAGAGYYFYASDKAKKHRQAASTWAKGLKRDVVREAKKLKKLDRKQVVRVVDEIAQTYEDVRGLNKKDLAAAVRELKTNWQRLQSDLSGSGKRAAATAKKSVKKGIKKAVRTATKRRK